MTLPSDWQVGKCLEWYTQLPFEGRPRESPVFLIQNTECYFQFCYTAYYYYRLYLKPKMTCIKLKSFPIIIYSDDAEITTADIFSRSCVTFVDSNQHIHSVHESFFTKRGQNLRTGHFIRFCFIFQSVDGPTLSLEKKSDEKSAQAHLMLSLQTDVEYLSIDFGELLRNGDHSDVQLLCKGGNIPAHRAILAARSKTFSDMFRDNTEECRSGLINFTTAEKSVIELCLEFIYKGKILNLPVEKASDLYILGHVLNIPSLMKVCADLMIRNLCEDNYISGLILVDTYDDDYFKSGIIDFISNHVKLLKSESWIEFSGEHMKTAFDVQRKCFLKFF